MQQVTKWSRIIISETMIKLISHPCHRLDPSYTLVAADKSHTRIIWDCAWSAEGDVFATASRDKTVGAAGNFKGASKSDKWVGEDMEEPGGEMEFGRSHQNGRGRHRRCLLPNRF